MMHEVSLKNVVDVHVHAKPDLYPRAYSDWELLEAGIKAGARGIVVKWHYGMTAARAALCNEFKKQIYPEAETMLYGSIVLNRSIGGLNPEAVETALKLGAKIVWMPTTDSINERNLRGKDDGILCVEHGKPVSALKKILHLIKEYDAVLATGHMTLYEIEAVVEAAKNMGINRILVDHPEYWVTHMDIEDQIRLVKDYKVCIGRYYAQPMKDGSFYLNLSDNLECYREIGYRNMIISTDGGQLANPHWEVALKKYMQYFADHGVPMEQIDYMSKELPKNLLGI